MITKSRHVDVYGVGGSGMTAVSLQRRLYRISVNAHAWTESHLGLASAALMDQDCVAIALSNSGQTRDTLDMVSMARTRGAFTVAMTSDPLSPVAAAANVHIQTCPSGDYLNPGELAAQSAQLFVINLLYLLVARCDHERADGALALTAAAVEGRQAGAPAVVGTRAPLPAPRQSLPFRDSHRVDDTPGMGVSFIV